MEKNTCKQGALAVYYSPVPEFAGGDSRPNERNGEVHSMENLKLLYTGKTKNVYALENGNCLLKFKDD